MVLYSGSNKEGKHVVYMQPNKQKRGGTILPSLNRKLITPKNLTVSFTIQKKPIPVP